MLRIALKPSRLLVGVVFLWAALQIMVLAWLITGWRGHWGALGDGLCALLLCAYGYWTVRQLKRFWQTQHDAHSLLLSLEQLPSMPVQWCVQVEQRATAQVVQLKAVQAVTLGYMIILLQGRTFSGKSQSIALAVDQMSPAAWRQLRVQLTQSTVASLHT